MEKEIEAIPVSIFRFWDQKEMKEKLFHCMEMNLGIKIASCWKEFNPQIKKLLSKKIPRGKPTEKENANLLNESTRAVCL